MDSNKRQSDITDQDLIDLLNDDNNEVNLNFIENQPDIFNFISIYKLKGGNDKINLVVLHNLYNTWSKESISKQKLRNQLKDIFKIDEDDNVYLELKESQISQMLLQVLNKKEKVEKSANFIKKRLNFFLNSLNIKSGTHFIKDSDLYSIYFQNNKKLQFKEETFINGLKNILNYKVDVHNVYWFGINKSQDEIETARKLNEKETNKKI